MRLPPCTASTLIHSFFPHCSSFYWGSVCFTVFCTHMNKKTKKTKNKTQPQRQFGVRGTNFRQTWESHVNSTQAAPWDGSSNSWAAVQLSSTDKKRWIDGEDEKRETHRGIVRPGWFRGSRCCHLLSPCVLAACLSAHSQNKPVHMSDLCGSLRLCACARPQKRVNASVRPAGLLSCSGAVLQAGILMSFNGFSDWNRGMWLQSGDSEAAGYEYDRGKRRHRDEGEEVRGRHASDLKFDREIIRLYDLMHSSVMTSAACDAAARYLPECLWASYCLNELIASF